MLKINIIHRKNTFICFIALFCSADNQGFVYINICSVKTRTACTRPRLSYEPFAPPGGKFCSRLHTYAQVIATRRPSCRYPHSCVFVIIDVIDYWCRLDSLKELPPDRQLARSVIRFNFLFLGQVDGSSLLIQLINSELRELHKSVGLDHRIRTLVESHPCTKTHTDTHTYKVVCDLRSSNLWPLWLPIFLGLEEGCSWAEGGASPLLPSTLTANKKERNIWMGSFICSERKGLMSVFDSRRKKKPLTT